MTESPHTYGWVMSHIWMSHGTGGRRVNESYPTHAPAWRSHAPHMKKWWDVFFWHGICDSCRGECVESCPTHEYVIPMSHAPYMPYTWRSRAPHMKRWQDLCLWHGIFDKFRGECVESCCTHASVLPMSHKVNESSPHMTESPHTYEWVISHIWMSHGTGGRRVNESWPTHGPHMKESWPTHNGVLKHILIEWCQTYEWVMSQAAAAAAKGRSLPYLLQQQPVTWLIHHVRGCCCSGERKTSFYKSEVPLHTQKFLFISMLL